MKLSRQQHSPSALIDFFEEGLGALGAICERTWHDRLHLVAEGSAARLWDPQGSLVETEIHFPPPEATGIRQAQQEVFPGCPLTFHLAEAVRPVPLPFERAILQSGEAQRAPTLDAAERLWHAQTPGCSRWKLEGMLLPANHFSLLVLARCEIQAIDQHWTLHRLAVSLPDARVDDSLASGLPFLQLSTAAPSYSWPAMDLNLWQARLRTAFHQELAPDLAEIRQRQQKYLERELERVDRYFQSYSRELTARQTRSRAEGSQIKAKERLAAARTEHLRRRQDQIRRHEIRVIVHLDALLLLGETAYQGNISFFQKGETHLTSAQFVPRSRRWVVLT